ncbi:hypothetical protein H6F61_17440 [Cyanobacteria bacterium FACHB-472]|nr:hypothetical protein [Cyanobacteria bacterium FACHB-472]
MRLRFPVRVERSRRILTDKGWKKIWDAIALSLPDRQTLQAISEQTGLQNQ